MSEPRTCALPGAHHAHHWVDDPTGEAFLCPGAGPGVARVPPRDQSYMRTRAVDEPVFTIRAQDILAPQALAAYAALARKLDLHDHAQRVEAIAVDFLAWQAAHSKQVKRPD